MAAITANTGSNNWNTNGAWVGGVQPTAADDVTIPATAVVTIPSAVTALCRSCTVQASGTLAFAATTSVLTIGDATAGAGNVAFSNAGTITLTAIGTINLISTSATAQTVTTGGQNMPIISINGAGGKWTLQDTFYTNGSILLNGAGTLDTNSQTVTIAGVFQSVGSGVRTLTLGSSTFNMIGGSSTNWNTTVTTNLTVTANTAVVVMNGTTNVFGGGTFNYNGLSVTGIAAGAVTVTGVVTLKNLTRTGTAAKTDSIIIGNNVTVTGTFTVTGNGVTNRVLVQSDVAGTARTITAAATVFSNVDFMDITGAGAGSWDVSTALLCPGLAGDCGGNTGITFCLSTTQQWSGTSGGNWSANAWTTRVPLAHDDVTFNTAFAAGQTVTSDMLRLGRNIDWTGATGAPTWGDNGVGNKLIMGSYRLVSGVTISASGLNWLLGGRAAFSITSAGVVNRRIMQVVAPGGTYSLTDVYSSPNQFAVLAGNFNSAGFALTAGTFTSSGSITRAITTGGSTWTLLGATTGGSVTDWNTGSTGLTWNDNVNVVVAETDARIKNGAMRFEATTVSYESAYYCARPAVSALTDDLEIIVRVSPDSWVPATSVSLGMGIWNNTQESGVITNQKQWFMGYTAAGLLQFGVTTDGNTLINYTSTTGHGFAAGAGEKWLKITRVKSTGAIDFYTAAATGNNTPPTGGSWSHVGTTVTGTTLSLYNSTSPLFVGSGLFNFGTAIAATIYYATVAPAVGGTPVATFDPAGRADGTISFTDSNSNIWIAHQTGDRSTARIAGGRAILPGTAGNYLSTPDSAALSITGDIDLRIRMALSAYTSVQTLIGKWASNQQSYLFRVNSAGNLVFDASVDGPTNVSTTSSVSTNFTGFVNKWLRATWRQSDGRVQFFTAPDSVSVPSGAGWTQLGTDRSVVVASIFDSTAALEVGSSNVGASQQVNGQIFRAQVRNNILDDGTGIVFDFDPSTVQDHSRLFKEKSSNAAIVTVNATFAGHTVKTWSQTSGTVPGTVTWEGGGGSGEILFAGSTAAVATLPSMVIPSGRTVTFTSAHLWKIPSWTQTTTATAGANTIGDSSGTGGFLSMSGTTGPTINYAGIINNRVSMLPPATFFEDFTLRGDSTNNLGNLDTGQTWVQSGTGTWGYLGGRMYQSAGAGSGYATFDCGLTDVDVRLVVTALPAANNLDVCARYTDTINTYWASVNSAGSMTLQKTVAGVSTQFGSNQPNFVAGDELGIRVYGSTIELLHNGNVRIAVTDSALTTGTKVGVISGTAGTTWRASSFRAGAPQFGTVTNGLDAGNNFNWTFTTPAYSNPYWIPRPRVY